MILTQYISSLTKKDFEKIPASSINEKSWSLRYGILGKILDLINPVQTELFDSESTGLIQVMLNCIF